MAGLVQWHLPWPATAECPACWEHSTAEPALLQYLIQVYGFSGDADTAPVPTESKASKVIFPAASPVSKKKPVLDAMAEIDKQLAEADNVPMAAVDDEAGAVLASAGAVDKALGAHKEAKETQADYTLGAAVALCLALGCVGVRKLARIPPTKESAH